VNGSSRRDVRIGVVGFGSIGRHHARNLRDLAGIELVGVTDLAPEALAQAAELGFPIFPSVEALIAARLDGVVLSVPTSLHEELAMPFIAARVALLVEKPLAGTLEAAKRLLQACKAAGVPLMVGYIERYNPAIVAMRDFAASGAIGEVISISTRRVGAVPPRIRDSSVLVDIGVHDIDMVAYITGARLTLRAAQGGMAVLHDRLDYASLMIDAEGCIAMVETNWVTPTKIRELSITGTNGFAHVDYITQVARYARGSSFEPQENFADFVANYEEGSLAPIPVTRREPLARELEVFASGIRGGELPDPGMALASLRIAEEATQLIERQNVRRPVFVSA